jgi:SAM-dependent methyltransferase
LYGEFWEKDILPTYGADMDEDRVWKERGWGEVLRHVRVGFLLDVGCGMGDFMRYVSKIPGWFVAGCDPDPVARESAQRYGVVRASVGACVRSDVVSMLQVLEHVRDPVAELRAARERLLPGGCLIVSVPNDFTPLQTLFRDQWWIHRHHVNYFSRESLRGLLEREGFRVEWETTSFPTPIWRLFSRGHRSGRFFHRVRKALDWMGLRHLYPLFAKTGLGRHVVYVARRVSLPLGQSHPPYSAL